MEYKINIYEVDVDNKNRFALGSLSENTLFVFGVNPSTADDKKPEQTISKVMGFAEHNDYKSFVMFNLYPQRAINPNDLADKMNEGLLNINIDIITNILSKREKVDILLAWGDVIFSRGYLYECMRKIYDEISALNIPVTWLRIGSLTAKNQPRHPSRPAYQSFQIMDMENYLK